MLKAVNVVGARPNLMKIAPIIREMRARPEIRHRLVHTGQHYDAKMSQVFFEELEIPAPDSYLGVGSGSHAEQTARVMVAFEQVLLEEQPDVVVVVGDVNSTLACAITAAKLWIPVAHVEAGLRSFDRRMPEEINRIVTDALSTYCFTTSRDANENLLREGVGAERIFFTGNVMIDTLYRHRAKATLLNTAGDYGLQPGEFALVTLHRPSNVDDLSTLRAIVDALLMVSEMLPVVFPVHPRTRRRLQEFGLLDRLACCQGVRLIEPLGYLAFVDLMHNARVVLTDSGGIQEETTILGVPCLTLRENTERPVTITEGTNELVGSSTEAILAATQRNLKSHTHAHRVPELWDGHAAERIVEVLVRHAGR
jgi:UDP-N-acetylglucosamine 2-epimerase (non-hydrolysing)